MVEGGVNVLSSAIVVFHSQLEARAWTRERITGQPEVILGDAGMGTDTSRGNGVVGEARLHTGHGLIGKVGPLLPAVVIARTTVSGTWRRIIPGPVESRP